MKIYMGPYRSWYISPYMLTERLKIFGVSEERRDAIAEYLRGTWVNTFCEWVAAHPLLKRKIKIRIDHYDIWSMDETIYSIVHPMLVKLKLTKVGAPYVEDSDVPEHLRSTAAPAKKNEWDIDDYHFDRFDWVLDEMIWAFDTVARNKEEDIYYSTRPRKRGTELLKIMQDRKQNANRLFGVYLSSLWD